MSENNQSVQNQQPSVKLTYWIRGEQSHAKEFNSSNIQTCRIGLPEGVEAVKPQAGDYSYSGMHDSGPLPLPKEGGLMADMISYVQKAKEANDEYLTYLIEKETTATVALKPSGVEKMETNNEKIQPDQKKARKEE